MQVLLEQLRRVCDRVCLADELDRALSLESADQQAALERQTTFLGFQCTVFCLLRLAQKRDRLRPERRQTLERMLDDGKLRGQLEALLAELLALELPEDLLYGLMQHGDICLALDKQLDLMFEGLE